MNVLRKLGLAFLAMVLFFSLLGTAWSHVGQATLGNRDTVKGWLVESQFYDRIIPSVLGQINKDSAASGEQQIPVDDPQIQAIIKSSISPDYLKQNGEMILDSTYAWLEGKTEKPEFSIDLAEAKQRLADGLGKYATAKAASLPACTPAQTAELANTESGFDILSAPCLPPGTNAQALADQLRSQIMNSEDFLGETTYTGDDLKVKSEGQEVSIDQSEEFKKIQNSYKLASYAPYIFGAVALLAAVGIIFLSPSKRKGVMRAGIVILVGGVLMGISYAAFTGSTKWLNDFLTTDLMSGEQTDPSELTETSKNLINDLVQAVYNDVGRLLLWYAIGFAAAGVVMILVSKFVARPSAPDLKQSADPEPPVDDSPKQDTAKTEKADKPDTEEKPKDKPVKKPPTKIQL